MTGIAEPMRPPAPDVRTHTEIGRFLGWLERERGLSFDSYADLHRWSVADLDGFWSSVASFFDVRFATPAQRVLGRREMPGAEWFPGATLNYAEHALRGAGVAGGDTAVFAYSQTRDDARLTWDELRDQVARARAGLQRLGVRRGDRVVAYLPNIPETVVAFLATASLGAVFASCAPEFGARSVIDRFAQVEPKVLLAAPGYRYGAKDIDRVAEVAAVRAGLPTVEHVVAVPYGRGTLPDTAPMLGPASDPSVLMLGPASDPSVSWADLLAEPAEPAFDPVPFAHPLYVLFSSGTTGRPKAIVHGHGGIVLEHLKNHALSWDLRAGDVLLWLSTTAWMMWNALVSGLLTGASIVLIDGDPAYPTWAGSGGWPPPPGRR